MTRTVLLGAVLSILGLVCAPQSARTAPGHTGESVASRSFHFESVVHVPELPAGTHELRLWIPLPYEDAYQSISGLRIESPVKYRIRREGEYGDRYAYMTIRVGRVKTPFDIRVSFDATRFEHRVNLGPAGDPQPGAVVLPVRFLQADRLVPVDGMIADLSRQETQGATLPVDKARKIYDYVIATMHYDHDGTEWGRGDAVWACNSKHGNCTDFHSLFIAMTRAAGIPARFEIGFPLPADSSEGAIPSYHCWAEFYIAGTGWIPIDASEAWKHKEKKDYYFGALDPNRVMFTMGRDVLLNPRQQGDPLNYSIYPYAEADEKPFTSLKSEYSFRDDANPLHAEANSTGGN
jgi:transglutaminase-like putative cysteine protease